MIAATRLQRSAEAPDRGERTERIEAQAFELDPRFGDDQTPWLIVKEHDLPSLIMTKSLSISKH